MLNKPNPELIDNMYLRINAIRHFGQISIDITQSTLKAGNIMYNLSVHCQWNGTVVHYTFCLSFSPSESSISGQQRNASRLFTSKCGTNNSSLYSNCVSHNHIYSRMSSIKSPKHFHQIHYWLMLK